MCIDSVRRQPYLTDVTGAHCEVLKPLIPEPSPDGRPAVIPHREIVTDGVVSPHRNVEAACLVERYPYSSPPFTPTSQATPRNAPGQIPSAHAAYPRFLPPTQSQSSP